MTDGRPARAAYPVPTTAGNTSPLLFMTPAAWLTAQGKVELHTSAYPLDAVNDAMADLDQGRLRGRGILVADAA